MPFRTRRWPVACAAPATAAPRCGQPPASPRSGRVLRRRDPAAPDRAPVFLKIAPDLVAGEIGMIEVRGPNVFLGYFEDPQATARALTDDGWLRTGDIAVIDDDGFFYMVDRAKDLIIVSGFNVYPAEVEEAIREHSAVAQAAVVGVEHPHSGEAVRAYVVLRPDAYLDEDAVIDHCRARLARYKCPTKVLFVTQLPVGATGKVLRRELR